MNGDIVFNERLLNAVRSGLERAPLPGVDVVVCPPFPYLAQAASWLGNTSVAWGAQNVSAYPNGAYTGEVSAAMLTDLGCRWAIIGHSERRQLAGETDPVVAAKVGMTIGQGLGVIVCVGETLDEREAGQAEQVLGRQIDAIVPAVAKLAAERLVIAYEPVWAIGTGRTASPEMAQDAHRFIRGRLDAGGFAAADSVRILYGGSVKPANAASLFAMTDIDGGLIGGAALVAEDFLGICRAAAVR